MMWTDRTQVAVQVTLDRWVTMAALEKVLKGAQFAEFEAELGVAAVNREVEDWQRIKAQAAEKGNTIVVAEADKALTALGYVEPVAPEPPSEKEQQLADLQMMLAQARGKGYATVEAELEKEIAAAESAVAVEAEAIKP